MYSQFNGNDDLIEMLRHLYACLFIWCINDHKGVRELENAFDRKNFGPHVSEKRVMKLIFCEIFYK
jgi:hypothetical protein